MTNSHWLLAFGVGFVVLPVVLYALHFRIYRDLHHIGIYTLGDIAFLPLEVLLVTLVIHQVPGVPRPEPEGRETEYARRSILLDARKADPDVHIG